MENAKAYVLDTSAIFCLKDDEAGADKVESILELARRGRNRVFISFMTAMEYLYINFMRYGEEAGHKAYLEMTMLPLEIVESDEDLRLIAAEFKAAHDISLADAWIAATAKKMQAVLVHRDPEFDSLKKNIDSLSLPYK